MCNSKSTMEIIYENVLKHPICTPNNCTTSASQCQPPPSTVQPCNLYHIREMSANFQTKSLQIYIQPPIDNTNSSKDQPSICPTSCEDTKTYIQHRNYCIPRVLLKDFLNFGQFQPRPIASTAYADIEFLLFFCHSMKVATSCEHLANLCVLSMYNLDKYSPCGLFFSTQTTISSGDGGFYQKVVPLLFFTRGKSSTDELEKVIDYRYGFDRMEYGEVNLS